MDIYRYIRESREARYRNAKAFWKSMRAPISYEYYSNIERGTKFPNIATVLLICDHLNMNKKKACFLWAMESMPSEESRAFFQWDDTVMDNSVPIGSQITLENTFLVTDAHRRLLESDPLYWEVLSFFAMHEDQFFTLQETLERIAIPKQQLLKVLGDLVHFNLLTYSRKKYSHPKTYMHIPNDKTFFKLRNQNFQHATKQLLHSLNPKSIVEERAVRTTLNKKLTPSQVESVTRHTKRLITELLNMKSPNPKDQGVPYSFCVLFCERDFRKRSKS